MQAVLGISVDLGWPWWVTTIIAVCVTAAACVVFVLAARPVVRAVAAVLAIQGIAIAVIAPFVMDANGGLSPSAMRAATPSATLTHAEFVRRADANCAAVDRFANSLGEWPEAKDLPATAALLDKFVPFMADKVYAQGTLRPPGAEQATATAWMHSMTASKNALETVRYSAKAGDRAGVLAGYGAADAADAKSTVLSKQLGLKVCFS